MKNTRPSARRSMFAPRSLPPRASAPPRSHSLKGRKFPKKVRPLLASRLESFLSERIPPFSFDIDLHFDALMQEVARANEEQHVKR